MKIKKHLQIASAFCIIESFLKIKAVCKAERQTAEINQYNPFFHINFIKNVIINKIELLKYILCTTNF